MSQRPGFAQHWRALWLELGRTADEALLRQLLACWGEGHRHYHTLQHLRECLDLFAPVRSLARHPAEVELALWFHDAFYDPARHDNEARSADWARASVLGAGLPAEVADRVHALVLATRHEAAPQEADACLLVDVDLAILGAGVERFDQSNEQIRAEFAHVPPDAYRAGRWRVLNGFLARPRLYSTEPFHARFEHQARDNLGRALARLAG